MDDKYSDKRLLFVPKLGLQKIGTFGAFWEQPRKQIWQSVIDKEKRIADGLEQPNIKRLVDHVHSWMPEESRQKIERSFGFHADSPAIQDWAQNIPDHDGNTDDDEVIANNDGLTTDREDNNLGDVATPPRRIPSLIAGKLGTRLWACMARVYVVLLGWCFADSRPRPSPLSSHAP